MDYTTFITAKKLTERIANLEYLIETKKLISIGVYSEGPIELSDLFGIGNESVFKDFLKVQLEVANKQFEAL
jgi:hypothetical protein